MLIIFIVFLLYFFFFQICYWQFCCFFSPSSYTTFVFILLKVHRIYRSTGASFQKAQAEFAQGVMRNETVQNAAANAAAGAARGAAQQYGSNNRY